MSLFQTHFGVTIVKCLVTTKINVVDTLYAATAVSPNIVHHLLCVTNQPNVSTALVITLQTQKQCPQWEKEKKILKIKCENNLSFPDARKQYEQFYTGQTYASAVIQGTCNKSTQTDNKSTQTDDSFTEYLKQTTEKTQGTKEKRNASPKPGKSNSSHSGPALKGATLEMIKKDEKKQKEEKDKLKKQQKEERKQQWQKEQTQKEKEQTEKAKQAEKNPYSVFAEKDDEEVCMEKESVVFTDSSSSDHLPKGTLPRLPITK